MFLTALVIIVVLICGLMFLDRQGEATEYWKVGGEYDRKKWREYGFKYHDDDYL